MSEKEYYNISGEFDLNITVGMEDKGADQE